MTRGAQIKGRTGRGFTMIEMLVAVAVLCLLVTLLAGILGNVSSVWRRSSERMDNFSKARALLNTLNRDLSSAVVRQDLPVFPSTGATSLLAFYALEFGQAAYDPNGRRLTYVTYARARDGNRRLLTRVDYPYDYSTEPDWCDPFAAGTAPSLSGTNVDRPLCEGVYAVVCRFINSDGSYSTTYRPATFNNAAPESKAVQISLMIAGEQADSLLQRAGRDTEFENIVHAVVPPSGSIKSAWDTQLRSGALNFPAQVLSGIRTYEKVVPLNSSPVYVPE